MVVSISWGVYPSQIGAQIKVHASGFAENIRTLNKSRNMQGFQMVRVLGAGQRKHK